MPCGSPPGRGWGWVHGPHAKNRKRALHEPSVLPASCRQRSLGKAPPTRRRQHLLQPAQYLNIFAAPMFAPAANNASTPSLERTVSQPPPKVMSWCSASIAQPVGTQCATARNVAGTISSGHQHPPSAAMIELANTQRPMILSSFFTAAPIQTPREAATHA